MTKYIIGLVAVVVIAGGVWLYRSGSGLPAASETPSASPAVSVPTTPTQTLTPTVSPTATVTAKPSASPITSANTFTAAQVATHNSRTSCYTIIRSSVYDVTSFIPNHPGGEEEILQLCGKDGTSLFENQHGGSALQENKLVTLKIGTLAP